ncbi:hypothetical protein J0X20_16820 [Streptomyces sp. KCTC 0041BP]|uniref:hypothetical protein n=1 Tax=Streptomyces sp. KCTC 0041BP TaxID=201500 RepID=UPI001AE2D197|nr:hypothetical protein [Streptomyces sp. KCTC 0041BP]MBP0935243.1 hypothetical protein [Streptomyces sp. KCTC 0041BP]
MQLDSITTVGPLITAGSALIVGVVTRWTLRGVAKDRIRWESKLEIAKLDAALFETVLTHLIEAADAGNRYITAVGDIDATDFKQREPYVFAILEPIGRARVMAHALPPFPGRDDVQAAIEKLQQLVVEPRSNKAVMDVWDPMGIDDAIKLLSRGRSTYMFEAVQPKPSMWRTGLARLRGRPRHPAEPTQASRGAVTSDIST